MLRRWLLQLRLRKRASARPSSLRARLSLVEPLEDRTTPTVFVVSNTADSGVGSLRQAMVNANADLAPDTIRFDSTLSSSTISLRTSSSTTFGPTALTVTSPILIEGSGQTIERSFGSGVLRLFHVTSSGQLTLQNLQLKDGWAQGGDGAGGEHGGGGAAGFGGAIYNQGTLSISGVTFFGNQAVGGNGGAGGISGGGLGGGGTQSSNGVAQPMIPPPPVVIPPIVPPTTPGPGSPSDSPGGIGAKTSLSGIFNGLSEISGTRENDLANWALAANSLGVVGGAFGIPTTSLGFSLRLDTNTNIPNTLNGAPGSSAITGSLPPITIPSPQPVSPVTPPTSKLSSFGEGGNAIDVTGTGGFGSGGAGIASTNDNSGFGGGSGNGAAGGGGGGFGGAIFNQGGTVTIVNSTFAYNTAKGGIGGDNDNNLTTNGSANGGAAFGAAFFNLSGSVTIVQSTFARNTVTVDPTAMSVGALYNAAIAINAISDDSASMSLVNSIVANTINGVDLFNNGASGSAVLNANEPNLVMRFSSTGAGASMSGIINADPLLGVLHYNGGPTQTMAPAFNSPVFNAGILVSTIAPLPSVDQRLGVRDGNPELGAFEFVSPFVPVGVPTALFPIGSATSSQQAFIQAIYPAIVQRPPNAIELEQFTRELQQGIRTRQDIITIVWLSSEHRSKQVVQYFRTFLDRDPTSTEAGFWTVSLLNGTSENEVVRRILSDPANTATLSDAAFVQLMFTALAGRKPTADELSQFTTQLGNGAQRGDVVGTFTRQSDVVRRTLNGLYRTYLKRSATNAEVNAAQTALTNETEHFGSIAVKVLASDEFWGMAVASVQ